MKRIILLTLISGTVALCGCTPEKAAPVAQQAIAAITLSPTDKEKLLAFQKEILSVESLTDKAVNIAVEELKKVITGGSISLDLPTLIEKAKSECLLAGESLAKKAIPESLPPEAKKLLNEGRSGLIAAYKAYAESFESIKSFVAEKNPLALLEYRKKNAQAQELYNEASARFKAIMTAAGITPQLKQ